MSLPSMIQIFNRIYRVIDMAPLLQDGSGLCGAAHYRRGEIHIDVSLDEALQWSTFWHEIGHILDSHLEGKQRENIARIFEIGVTEVLMNNPEVVEWYASLHSGLDQAE